MKTFIKTFPIVLLIFAFAILTFGAKNANAYYGGYYEYDYSYHRTNRDSYGSNTSYGSPQYVTRANYQYNSDDYGQNVRNGSSGYGYRTYDYYNDGYGQNIGYNPYQPLERKYNRDNYHGSNVNYAHQYHASSYDDDRGSNTSF